MKGVCVMCMLVSVLVVGMATCMFVVGMATDNLHTCRMLRTKVAELFVGGFPTSFSKLDLHDPQNKGARQFSGRIIECSWDKKTKKWKFLKVREDKSFPNGLQTALSKLLVMFKSSSLHESCFISFCLSCWKILSGDIVRGGAAAYTYIS